jgi:catechol 2,3-dioxygenase-like lactoylglutathione lyase family enzyme
MLDHVIVTVSDFARSIAFYAQALKPLGITDFLDYKGQDGHPDLKGFGNDGRFFFWLKEGRPNPDAVHFGFVAKSHAEVNAFFVAAIAAGGRRNAIYDLVARNRYRWFGRRDTCILPNSDRSW